MVKKCNVCGSYMTVWGDSENPELLNFECPDCKNFIQEIENQNESFDD